MVRQQHRQHVVGLEVELPARARGGDVNHIARYPVLHNQLAQQRAEPAGRVRACVGAGVHVYV